MKRIIILACAAVILTACSSNGSDKESHKKELNDQLLKCIAVMNEADRMKNEAAANGDQAGVQMQQARIDSAAKENVMIGQKLSELNK